MPNNEENGSARCGLERSDSGVLAKQCWWSACLVHNLDYSVTINMSNMHFTYDQQRLQQIIMRNDIRSNR